MKEKVALIYSNVVKEPWMPLGLMYIASTLKKYADCEVKIFDSKTSNLFDVFMFSPDYVGLGGMSIMSQHAVNFGKALKEVLKDSKFIYGGNHFTFIPEDAFGIADYIIKGEAEIQFLNVVKGSIDKKGVLYRNIFNRYVDLGDWERIEDLDYLPFPAYDLVNVDSYHDELVTGEKAISIMTGRGCPYNCSFCASPQLYKRKVRYHSIQYVMEHIEFLIKNYNLQALRIMDDTFTLDNKRVTEFCEEILKRNIKLKITCLTNINNVDKEVFKLMHKAGFEVVAFGIESANDDVLKMIEKNNSKEKARNAVNVAHEAGLKTELLFMVGNIGETYSSLKESLEFAKELNGFKTYFQLATPFPGSRFYDCAEKYGKVIDRDWEHYNHKEVKYIPNGLTEELLLDVVKEGTKN